MAFIRRKQAAEQLEALAEARRREDAAPRLRDVVPTLRSLRLHLHDRRPGGQTTAMPYTRHVMVTTGPALFIVRCTEPRCSGRHELTNDILASLRKTEARSEGESVCQGYIGETACDRTLIYVCEAEFKP